MEFEPAIFRLDKAQTRTHHQQRKSVGISSDLNGLVPLTGIEPVRCCHHGILSPGRLPIPPQRQLKTLIIITRKGWLSKEGHNDIAVTPQMHSTYGHK